MSIGMSYEEFWYKDVSLVEFYRKAETLRVERTNQELWLEGRYIYEALCDSSPLFRFSMSKKPIKPLPYLKEPFPITKEEAEQREEHEARIKEEKLKAEFAAFVGGMIERNKNKAAVKNNVDNNR